jgi:NAD(P)-dependent dehydrogenase (short-subunit alcohol dehydrogenase family)
MEKIFKDKVALITGGSFGIGKATALAFAQKGANVVVADWVEDNNVISLLNKEGGKNLFIKCDVSKSSEVKALVDRIIAEYGRLDYAFNNAGVEGQQAQAHEYPEAEWARTIDVNLKGVFLCMKYQIPHMLNRKGVIINCASIAGLIGFPGLSAYVASKHAVIGLTKTTALEYAKQGIRVNAICPGVIRTAMIDRVTGKDKAVEKIYEDMEPIGRMGSPDEVAAAVVWLCSDAASFITGVSLPVDGGWIAKS